VIRFMLGKDALSGSYKKIVEEIKTLDLNSLSNGDLLNLSKELRRQVLLGADINKLLVEGFALVKEAAKRTLGFEVYDVQLLAATALHDRKMIEMKTGEGKTLTAVFPAYLNALSQKGVHILTFNDYLARRDANWMRPIYEMLGITVGFVQEKMDKKQKHEAYSCDITYVTAKEAGFDYLRDSICFDREELIHRPFHFAIIDEADSILIDEARIPLVIAVSTEENNMCLQRVREAITALDPAIDYETDEYSQNVVLTESGIDKIEAMLGCRNLYDTENYILLAQVNSALYAEVLLQKDINYIVRKGKLEMVDEFTGRVAVNRHWPDGLQGALECKENLEVQSKGRILTQITLQHFIALYDNLAGMTGTAVDSAEEFFDFYGMDVIEIPPNRPSLRKDCIAYVFTHKETKYKAIVEEIIRVHSTGQPILIGTSSVKESADLASLLLGVGVKCKVLNAKNDEFEANIIEKAGVLGAVTVSTNMAGRGVDILLGGPDGQNREKIKKLGGLYVIGTNLYESLRIDKQLMGRAGRQGDPGMTRFFVSLEDDLMVKYGIRDFIPKVFQPKKQDKALSNPIFKKKIDLVQRIVQGQNSDLRRELYRFSSLVDRQRQHLYNIRMQLICGMLTDVILENSFPDLYERLSSKYSLTEIGKFKRNLRLFHMDQCWADYLEKVATFKEGIHLQVVARRDPLAVFQMQLIEEFKILMEEIEQAIIGDYVGLAASKVTFEELNERNKPPVTTWTYFVSDDSFEDIIGFIKGIGKGLGGLGTYIDLLSFALQSAYSRVFAKDS
ncbi:MAG: accessory Sec system translocase SecA2, partial [Bacillota bacterium]|nr:accessory Sec system translocase SecA2 [Bacillota bacterium]